MKQHGLTLALALVVAVVAGYALAVYYPPPGLRQASPPCPCCPDGKRAPIPLPMPRSHSRLGCDCGYGCSCSEDGQCSRPTKCPNIHPSIN